MPLKRGLDPLASKTPVLAIDLIAYANADGDDNGGHERNKNEHNTDEEAEEFWEEIHEVSSNFMLLLVFLHIAGVIVSGRIHNEPLVKAMITGKKSSRTDA